MPLRARDFLFQGYSWSWSCLFWQSGGTEENVKKTVEKMEKTGLTLFWESGMVTEMKEGES